VRLGGATLFHASVPPAVLAAAAQAYLDNGKWCVFEGETRVCMIRQCPLFDYGGQPAPVSSAADFAGKFAGEAFTKITMEGAPTPAERALFEPRMTVIQFAVYSEAIVAGVSKVTGMDLILSALGLSRRDALAVGDSENDLGLVEAAGCGAAMGNSCPALKARAQAVVAPVGQGGVAEAVRLFTGLQAPASAAATE